MADDPRARRLEQFRTLAGERLGHVSLGWIELEQGPVAPSRTESMLRELHTLKGEAGLMGFSAVADALHVLEDLVGGAVRAQVPVETTLGDLVLRGLEVIGAAIAAPADAPPPSLAGFLHAAQAGLHAVAAHAGARTDAPIIAASLPAGVPAAPAPREELPAPSLDESATRIHAEQLDRLRDAIGELVMMRHRIADAAIHAAGAIQGRLRDDVRRLAAVIGSLDGVVRELRMVPVERLLERFPLVARELGRELGKSVRVAVSGAAVEADRVILERLRAPLLHLVRNAIDHGLETPAERAAAGKPEVGTIQIAVDVAGNSLRILVRDDGRGIDVDLVRRRAVEQGLIEAPSARVLSDEQVLAYLFSSGFSTRKTVTRVSGRGVGLDVVRTTIESLGGTVATDTAAGTGTSFTITVPVSALITPLLLCEIGEGHYAVPTAEVVALVRVADAPVVDSIDGPAVRWADALVPIVPLPEVLGEPDVATTDARLVIARAGDVLMALAGTRRHRDREVVVRSAGPILDGNPYVRGGIDLEDGSVALVLELGRMVVAARAIAARARHRGGEVGPPVAAKVLVVEDSSIMREIIAEALRAHGVEVIEAGDGVEALAALELHADVDLVVTDLEMPRIDGFELIRRIRAQARVPRLPAVVISTRGSDADKLAAIEVGADAYLVKTDFSRESLWSHIGRFLAP